MPRTPHWGRACTGKTYSRLIRSILRTGEGCAGRAAPLPHPALRMREGAPVYLQAGNRPPRRTPRAGRDTRPVPVMVPPVPPALRALEGTPRTDGERPSTATLRMREGGLPWEAREPHRSVAGKGVPWGFMGFRRFRRLLKNASVMERSKQSHLEKTLPFQHAVQTHRSNLLTGPLEEGPLPRSFFPILAETRYSLAECEKTGGTRARYTGHRTKNPKRESHPEIYGGAPCPR